MKDFQRLLAIITISFGLFIVVRHSIGQAIPQSPPPPIANDCTVLTGDCTTELSNTLVDHIYPVWSDQANSCASYPGAVTKMYDTAGSGAQVSVGCTYDGYNYFSTSGSEYFGDTITVFQPTGPVFPATSQSPNLNIHMLNGFTLHALALLTPGTPTAIFVISGLQTGPIFDLVWTGSTFRLDSRVPSSSADSPTAYSQYLWDPANPTMPFQETLTHGYYNYFHVFLTVTPDGRARLDVLDYNPANSSGLLFDWYQTTIEGGIPAIYSETTGASSKTLLGTNDSLILSFLGFNTQNGRRFPTSWAPSQQTAGYGRATSGDVYDAPLGRGAILAKYIQDMSQPVTGSPAPPPHLSDTPTADMISGGVRQQYFLYPCNTGAFLTVPLATGSTIGVTTPCGQLLTPFSPPPMSFSAANWLINGKNGQTKNAGPVTLTNGSPSPVTFTIGITGANTRFFGQTNNCGGELAAGASCQITPNFTMQNNFAPQATLQITSDPSQYGASLLILTSSNE